MRVLVTGSRDMTDYALVKRTLDEIKPSVIIQGECPYGGADDLAARYAEANKLPCIGMRAHFKTIGKAAGPIRNGWMLKHAAPIDLVVAFPGGTGTANMLAQAEKAGIPTREVKS